jgi:hypothetical protein
LHCRKPGEPLSDEGHAAHHVRGYLRDKEAKEKEGGQNKAQPTRMLSADTLCLQPTPLRFSPETSLSPDLVIGRFRVGNESTFDNSRHQRVRKPPIFVT